MTDDNRISTGSVLEPSPSSGLPLTFQQLRVHTGWRTTWTHIVGGKFSNSHDDAVLFYEGATGFAEIYDTDGHGNMTLLRQHQDLGRIGSRSHRWTHIVKGRFSDTANSSLLLVDSRSGFAAIFNVSSTGDLIKLREYPHFGHWTQVTAVRLMLDHQNVTTRSGVLLYDQETGHGEILECDASGKLKLRQESDGWRKTWSHVVGGFASGISVLFYQESTGHCEIYQLNYDPTAEESDDQPAGGSGANSLGVMAAAELPPGATIIVGGSFGLDFGFVAYFPELGRLQFLFMVQNSDQKTFSIDTQEFYDGLGGQWDLIASGGFWTPDEEDYKFPDGRFSSLLFYDQDAGRGEFHLHSPFRSYAHAPFAGYTSRGSVRPGESIDLFVSSAVGAFAISIYRLEEQRQLMAEVLNHANAAHPLSIPRLAYRDGPGWDPVATVQIPADWPSGLYVAQVTEGQITDVGGATENDPAIRSAVVPGQHRLDIPFVVRRRDPGSQSKILVLVNDTTYEAYNFWGRSLYGYRVFDFSYYTAPGASTGVTPRGFRVNFRRPYIGETGYTGKKWTYWEEPLAKWLGRLGIDVEWANLVDLHQDPELLDAYDMVVSVGHAEYFSREIYDRLLAFITRGGNAAFFSGNNCWWRIRIEDDGDTMVCYKNEEFDLLPEKTINWSKAESGALLGTHQVTVFDLRNDITGNLIHFVVREPAHWVFAGTGLQEGESLGTFGNGQTVAGYETDLTTGENEGWTTLADVHAALEEEEKDDPPEIATMMISEKTGAVFTASTVDWTLGLSQDADTWTAIDQITLNLFVRLGRIGAVCDIVGFDSNGEVQADFTNSGFRSTWDVMLAGAFTRRDRDQIVLYDRAGGALAVVGFDNAGRANLDRTDGTIGSNWSTLVAGEFVGNHRKQVLMYDKSTGDTLLVGFDGAGNIDLRRAAGGWRTSWDLITVGPFIGNGCDQVLLYDRADGTADIVGFDATGNVHLDTSNTGWSSSWDWMVPGHFLGKKTSEVWLCDRTANFAEVVAFDAAGNFRSMAESRFDSLGAAAGKFITTTQDDQPPTNQQQILRWPNYEGNVANIQNVAPDGNVLPGEWPKKAWNWLVVGRFRGRALSEYVKYTAADGSAEMYGEDGIMSRLQDFSGWRSSWVLAASGRFLGNGRDQLALYDRGRF